MSAHPLRRLLQAEDLVRQRRSGERRRYVASQRCGRIDPNPHQIDAVMFALGRVREGGCILADEVGLGKTIEAGVVMAQLLAEGARRILLIAPKPLLGQWRNELFDLFAIETTEGSANPKALDGDGVFLVGREFVGTAAGSGALNQTAPFDLCVVDEAHEVFAGIYRRYDKYGNYDSASEHAKTAGSLRELLQRTQTPVLLLTATPIQNSLTELWGLVQYVDRGGTLLGDLRTFRQVFCDGDDRQLVKGQEEELKRRMGAVVKRTLRRQAQEFMTRPFVGRRTRLFEYDMSPEEKQLYEDVTDYLLRPNLAAFRGSQRRLLLIGFHRRMASSHRALAASLDRVAERLRKMLAGGGIPSGDDDGTLTAFNEDLEESEYSAEDDIDESGPPADDAIEAELQLVQRFSKRASALKLDGKARALVHAIRLAMEREEEGESTGKLVIFTESLATQDYIRDLLLESKVVANDEVTLFRGTNDTPRAQQALDRWIAEIGSKRQGRPSRDIAVRLALVHEFRTRSRVFVSTEAGAKGLNLQFCDTLINYDLPWNPQRIEQRIGRCHRYGQERDVTVINFLARDNEAQRLTFEILSKKLELFGTVLDASDTVLHTPADASTENLAGALSADFESTLRRIYERARTVDEIAAELRELRKTMDSRRSDFEALHARTAGLIESKLDDSVRRVFRGIQESLPTDLAEFDRAVEQVLRDYLDVLGVTYRLDAFDGGSQLVVGPSGALPDNLQQGLTVALGNSAGRKDAEPVHLKHPLVLAAVADARARATQLSTIRLVVDLADDDELRLHVGRRGRLVVVRVRYHGFEPAEQVLPLFVLPDAGALEPQDAARLLAASTFAEGPEPTASVSDEEIADPIEEALFADDAQVSIEEEAQYTRAMRQLERFVEDRIMVLQRQRTDASKRLRNAQAVLDAAVGAAQRTKAEEAVARHGVAAEDVEAKIAKLRARDDDAYERWRTSAQTRRYEPPSSETLLDVEFVIDARGG